MILRKLLVAVEYGRLGLLLCTEPPIMMPNGHRCFFSFLFLTFQKHAALDAAQDTLEKRQHVQLYRTHARGACLAEQDETSQRCLVNPVQPFENCQS